MKSEKDSTIVGTRKKKPRTLADEVADLKRRMEAVEKRLEKAGI